MDDNQVIDNLTEALVKSGPRYEPETSREVASSVYKALVKQAVVLEGWRGENTCIRDDLGMDSLDLVEMTMDIEDDIGISFALGVEKTYWDNGKTKVLDILQLAYRLKSDGHLDSD